MNYMSQKNIKIHTMNNIKVAHYGRTNITVIQKDILISLKNY